MSDFLLFLGRFHVLALHLPIGMLLMTVMVHWLGKGDRFSPLQQVLPLLWGLTALSAVLTVALGILHFGEGGFNGASANAHRFWGIGFAVATVITWLISIFNVTFYREWGSALCGLLLIAVTMTGHYGGNLTHGSTYLVEYAPQSIRNMAGLDERRAPVTSLAAADPYVDVIAPMLEQRCGNCHNADKQRGELDLSSLDALMVGGESGAVVLSGNARGSELYKRITLPPSHDDFMPAEGKTPLTDAQVQILGWWIDAGLPSGTTLGSLSVDPPTSSLIAVELGLAGPVPTVVNQDQFTAASNSAVDALLNIGWQVRPLSQASNGLVVSVLSRGQPVSRDMLFALGDAAEAIVDLDLSSTGLNDELLALLPVMQNLEKLNLSNNGLGDAGLSVISSDTSLTVLNLYGNPGVTDAVLDQLAGLGSLDVVYLWGTSVTAEGVAGMQRSRADLTVIR